MKIRICATFLRALALGALAAQAAPAALADDSDPPALVGRVSFVQGNAGLQAGNAAAEQADLNRPVTIGDRLRTENQGLLEISLGTAVVRLDQNTDMTVANLDDNIVQLQLDGGAMSLHVFELNRDESVEIDTPTVTVRVLEAGDYRIDSDDDGMTRVAVRHGDAEVDGGGGPVHVRDQQQLMFAGTDAPADVISLTTPDDFDQWSMSRDRHFDAQKSSRYLSREVVGYEDLDTYGTWDETPEYGAVWYPTDVPDDWAPYRVGRWVWVAPWGWSWVDDAPWGFAPFHYGRWAFVERRWCWVPGPRHVRPVYAPALVAWNGGVGVGVSVGFSITNRPSRWLPLGPREVYVPAHRVSPRYLRNVNVSNTVIVNSTVITNAYRGRTRDVRYVNRNAPNALTTREILPRVARPAPVVRPLPPRPQFSRGVVQREGVPVAIQPPRPMPARAFRNDRDDRHGNGERSAFGARPGLGRPSDRGQSGPEAAGQDRTTIGRPPQPQQSFQRPPLEVRPQIPQRARIQQQADSERRDDIRRNSQFLQEQQARQDQQARQEQSRQDQQARQERQAQFQAQQAERQNELRQQQFQREQQSRQQAQFQAQQAERQNELRQQQFQREQQSRQQAQFQAQQGRRESREQAARSIERRELPSRRDRTGQSQLR